MKGTIKRRIGNLITTQTVFMVLAVVNIFIMFLMIYISRGRSVLSMTYGEGRFCDFWAHIFRILTQENVYGNISDPDAIFPPLAYCMLNIFALPMQYKVEEEIATADIASSGFGMLILILYITIFLIGFIQILNHYFKQQSILSRTVLSYIMVFSYPFWACAFERGNLVMYAMLFLMLGMLLRHHPNKVVREISLLCVAISAGLKLYPALFGILWIVEKRYKEAIRLIIYGLLMFFVPLFAIADFKDYYGVFNRYLGKDVYSQTSIWGNCIRLFGERGKAVAAVLIVIWIAWCVFYAYTEKVNWKVLALFTSLQTIIIPESYVYTYVFIAIPLFCFLKENNSAKMDIVYAVLFALVFTCPPLINIQSAVFIGIYVSWIAMLGLISLEKVWTYLRKL